MNIWIDDKRDPDLYRGIYNIPEDVFWAKTFDEAKTLIEKNKIEWVGFDNDLGDLKDRQGKHLFALLEQKVYEGSQPIFEAVFQTSNIPARQEMLSGYKNLLNRFG